MRGRVGKDIFSNKDDTEKNKNDNPDLNLYNSLVNPLPDYNILKNTNPLFSFPKDERFEAEKVYELPGPDAYFQEDNKVLDYKKENL